MRKNSFILIALLIAIAGAIYFLESKKPHMASGVEAVSVATSTVHTPDYATLKMQYPMAAELVHPDGYINAPQGFTLSSLIGQKVVLLDFWTYSCINCQRTIPYLNAWYQKYKDFGLEIVGVHTPEFDFEKVLSNVQMGVAKFGIKYPVVLDSEYATWQAYGNNYWPEHYLIDINGLVVDRHIGEGGYAETEQKIQQLLHERALALGEDPSKIPTGTVDIMQAINANSPETYFGSARNEYLGNGAQHKEGMQALAKPAAVMANTLYLSGAWDFAPEYATASKDAHIIYKYDAQNVYFVASAPSGATLTVLRDGVPLTGEGRGEDVDSSGNVQVKESRLYTLVKEKEMGEHTLEIIIHDAGLQAFTFTFG
jgi:thiol-disulfide isomerase/thioredoxin